MFEGCKPQARGGAVWQLVGLITRRSKVQILPPQPTRLTLVSCEALEKERNNVRGIRIDAPEMISLEIAGRRFRVVWLVVELNKFDGLLDREVNAL